jgi:hypothetical protein
MRTFTRKWRNSLTAVAHHIAMRFRDISLPFIERGEETPRDLLAHEFGTICAEYEDMHGGPLTTAEMELLANKFVPKAIDSLTKRIQKAADFVGGLADSMEAAKMRGRQHD